MDPVGLIIWNWELLETVVEVDAQMGSNKWWGPSTH